MLLIMCICIAMCIGGGSGSPTGVELYGTTDDHEQEGDVYRFRCREGRVLVPSTFPKSHKFSSELNRIYMAHVGNKTASIDNGKNLECGDVNRCWKYIFNCVDASAIYEYCPKVNSHLVIANKTCGYIKHCSTDDTGCTDCSINIKAREGHVVYVYNYYNGQSEWKIDGMTIEANQSRDGKTISLQLKNNWQTQYKFLFEFYATNVLPDENQKFNRGSNCSATSTMAEVTTQGTTTRNTTKPPYLGIIIGGVLVVVVLIVVIIAFYAIIIKRSRDSKEQERTVIGAENVYTNSPYNNGNYEDTNLQRETSNSQQVRPILPSVSRPSSPPLNSNNRGAYDEPILVQPYLITSINARTSQGSGQYAEIHDRYFIEPSESVRSDSVTAGSVRSDSARADGASSYILNHDSHGSRWNNSDSGVDRTNGNLHRGEADGRDIDRHTQAQVHMDGNASNRGLLNEASNEESARIKDLYSMPNKVKRKHDSGLNIVENDAYDTFDGINPSGNLPG